ncbi:class I SAM-dependent methyltransferase [Mucilaginibacter ximonensis]|uniref:Class I SAM-dependent methyltransferase n=1 Tax=Mucilaginibacter ximonensis TaxID=538021 RepID=A0ABW5YD58_9SPHI
MQQTVKVNYGIDAPGVIRNLFVAAFAALLIGLLGPAVIKLGAVQIESNGFIWMGLSVGLGGLWMLVYSVYGKYIHRDRMLNLVSWRGDEHALDIGTGRGLLLIGIAKRLSTGKATGIDVWNAQDLSANNADNTYQNAHAEGVADKVEVLNENAMHMSFNDESFDLVFTNECIHNIAKAADRARACAEIIRVLKPHGTAIISDHTHMAEYQKFFKAAGCEVEMINPYYLAAYPPLRILRIKKSR